jgi:hypothetical protein
MEKTNGFTFIIKKFLGNKAIEIILFNQEIIRVHFKISDPGQFTAN